MSSEKDKKMALLHQIIDILSKFSENLDKRLNFDKVATYFKLSSNEAHDLLSLLLNFQELFSEALKGYSLQKKVIDNQYYLIAKKHDIFDKTPKKIIITMDHINLLSDIIYYFKQVKRGKGFDISANGTELIKIIKELRDSYPYFFQRQNGLLYPSELGVKLGELLISYKKSNKRIEYMEIEDHEVHVI